MSTSLSAAAGELLVEASRDPRQTIIRLSAMGSTYLRTHRRILGGPAAEVELWERALQELLRLGLIESLSDDVYSVTPEGYEAAALMEGKREPLCLLVLGFSLVLACAIVAWSGLST